MVLLLLLVVFLLLVISVHGMGFSVALFLRMRRLPAPFLGMGTYMGTEHTTNGKNVLNSRLPFHPATHKSIQNAPRPAPPLRGMWIYCTIYYCCTYMYYTAVVLYNSSPLPWTMLHAYIIVYQVYTYFLYIQGGGGGRGFNGTINNCERWVYRA